MRIDPLVAKNYAHALLNVVNKAQMRWEDAYSEAVGIKEVLRREPKLYDFLAGPQFADEEKEALIKRVFDGRVARPFFLFVLLLLRRNRIEHIAAILSEFQEQIERDHGVIPGLVTTAIPLSEDGERYMQEKLEAYCGRKFHLHFEVDESLIGGVRFKYGDILMDTSISTYLIDLRRQLSKARLAS